MGHYNKSLDKIPRKDYTNTKDNPTIDYDSPTLSKWHEKPNHIDRLKCEICGSTLFEILYTDDYETTAYCVQCELYNIVHTG
jgi:hypothetical protein